MSEYQCKRCDEPIEPPGRSIPLLAVPLLFVTGSTRGFTRTGYCSACAGFAALITVVVCAVLLVAAVVIIVAVS
jgi:hypothetical protein